MFRAWLPRVWSGGVIASDALASRSGVVLATRADKVSGHSYLVSKWLDQWRVKYEDTPIGTFDDRAEATHFACDVARIHAEGGVATSVEVQAAVLETHHFLSIALTDVRSPRHTR